MYGVRVVYFLGFWGRSLGLRLIIRRGNDDDDDDDDDDGATP